MQIVARSNDVKRQVGYAAMGLSTVAWLLIFALPFVQLETETKLAVGSGLYALSYALFFLSGALLGREVIDKMKSYCLGFLKRNTSRDTDPGNSD